MTVELYLAFILTGLVVIASPGPTSFLVLAHAMGTNRRSPAFAIAGILCSNVVFVSVTVLGLMTALSASQPALVFMRTLGAVYLIYLGGKHIVTAFQAEQFGRAVSPVSHTRARVVFLSGVSHLNNKPQSAPVLLLALLSVRDARDECSPSAGHSWDHLYIPRPHRSERLCGLRPQSGALLSAGQALAAMPERRLSDCYRGVHGKNGSGLMEDRARMPRLIKILGSALSDWLSEARSA